MGDPLASWQQSRARLAAAIAVLDERPNVEAACELKTLALRLWQSASLWADTGRLDAVRTRLAAMLAELAPLAGAAVSCAQAGLADRQWSAQDAEWLETLAGQLDGQISAARGASEAFRDLVAALDAAHAEKRYADLADLALRTQTAEQQAESAHADLTTLLQALAVEPDIPDAGQPEPEPEIMPPAPEPSAPSADSCASAYPHANASPVAVTPALPDAGSDRIPLLAAAKPLSRAVGVALKSAAPVLEWPRAVMDSQPHADNISPGPAARNTGEAVTLQVAGDDGGPAASIEPANADADAGSTVFDAIPTVSPPASTPGPERSADTSSTHETGPAPSAPNHGDTFETNVDPARVGAILWQAVADHRCGLAWHLARAVPSALAVPPALFAALALAPCVRSADDEACVLFGEQAALLTGAGSDGSDMQPIPASTGRWFSDGRFCAAGWQRSMHRTCASASNICWTTTIC